MKNEKFERLMSEIRNEQVDDQVVAESGQRVWKSITGAAPVVDLNTQVIVGQPFPDTMLVLFNEYLGRLS